MWEILCSVMNFLWSAPLMIFMVSVGFYLSAKTGFFQITGIKIWANKTIGEFESKKKLDLMEKGELKQFQALSTVLAGTIGSGNIAGVAAAIAIGGPGAVFWMWVIALVGMMIKMAEVTLSVKFRKKSENNEFYGGPMYYMKSGLGKTGRILAKFYAVALFVEVLTDACFVQPNTLATCVNDVLGIPLLVSGIAISAIGAIVILSGGVKKIGAFCGKIVIPMIIIYIVSCLVVIISNITVLPSVFSMIIRYAFAPAPPVGGFVGSSVSLTIARGASRGIFSNEAGMGTAATVHATAQTDDPVHQGMFGILEVFVDTIVVCTLTSFAILCSGVWTCGNTGVVLTFDAFRSVWGLAGNIILCIVVVLFTFSSYLGFFVEFRTCVEYLFGEEKVKIFQWIFFAVPIISVTLQVEAIWDIADMAVGFIVIPNMIAILMLSPIFFEMMKKYKKQLKPCAKNKWI